MKREILKDMDSLEYSPKDGFYDKELDMVFRHLEEWLKSKYGVTFKEVLQEREQEVHIIR